MATSSDTILGTAADGRAEARLVPRAAGVVAAGVAIGIVAQLLLFDVGLGLNLAIAVALILAAGWALREPRSRLPALTDLWLPVAAIVLAAFVAVRGDPTLQALDTLGAIVLTGAALASFGGLGVVTRPFANLLSLGAAVAGWALGGAAAALGSLRRVLPAGAWRERSGIAAAVVRGLLIALPLLLVFTVLFASADAVFEQILADLFDWDVDLGSLPGRLALALVAGWVACGLLAMVTAVRDVDSGPLLTSAWDRRPRLGSVEAVTLLVALDLLFIGFVALQATYLFGGRDTLSASGLTHAEYARRGFFELLAVAFAVGGLVLALEAFVARRSRAYLAGAIGLVVLTMVVLASAYLRLRLYQDAYGWTELRFYVLAAILWLALGAMGAIAGLATDRTRWLPHWLMALSVAFGLAFNAIGPVRYIAERNVERAIHPELVAPGGETGLDVWYLAALGDDAIVVLAEAAPSLPDELRADVELAIGSRHPPTERVAWQEWNLARERARDLLR
jgi:hypothetical protein